MQIRKPICKATLETLNKSQYVEENVARELLFSVGYCVQRIEMSCLAVYFLTPEEDEEHATSFYFSSDRNEDNSIAVDEGQVEDVMCRKPRAVTTDEKFEVNTLNNYWSEVVPTLSLQALLLTSVNPDYEIEMSAGGEYKRQIHNELMRLASENAFELK